MHWQAGIGRRVITPETEVWLAGYGTKRAPDGKIHDLWVKVLALRASADGVFGKDKSYQAWHPDHVDIRWIRGEPLQEGSVVHFEQYLHSILHKLKFRITKVIPNRLIEYRILFPMSLLSPANSFVIEPKSEGRCMFTAQGSLRIP